jgi:sulfatase modifying factor 1
MIGFDRDALLDAGAAGLCGDAHDFQVAADRHLSLGDEATALIALDRAYGLAPSDAALAGMRAALLDRLAVAEHGLAFRYVPAGTFLMGSVDGDPDERPVHAVHLDEFWIADIPMTWTAFCRLAGWRPPPEGNLEIEGRFYLAQADKIRIQYCESERTYDRKPMAAVSWRDAEQLAQQLSTAAIEYALPSEAEWEKAARGGLIGKRYPWGDEAPTQSRCDFNHFGDFRIGDPRLFPPNGYGLHAMAGGVWEWTSTVYDALAYGSQHNPPPSEDEPQQRVLRGGSWADAAAAMTVSFRSAALGAGGQQGWGDSFNPNVGFRLVRRVRRS